MATSAILLLACTIAVLSLLAAVGDWPERVAVAGFVVLMVGSRLVEGHEVGNIRDGVAYLSVSFLVLLSALALITQRWWLLAATGLQCAVVATYALALMEADLLIWSGVAMRQIIWWQLMGACLVGVCECWILRRDAGSGTAL